MEAIKYKPAIVLVAYNRLNSLKRLLGSLKKGHYPQNTRLIISIDHSPGNSEIVEFAGEFEWEYGQKEIIVHSVNIGLRKHIISCGDLTLKYGSVIILEDDLFVSPFFYLYALKALEFYKDHPSVSGIGLFNYSHIESIHSPEPFSPVIDGSDVYYLQYACSSGQAWTDTQWTAFRDWYDGAPALETIKSMPEFVLSWPERSWKKYFIAFLIARNSFFVYPRVSLTTNFDDMGTNRSGSTSEVQSILLMSHKDFSFSSLNDSLCVYDSHFEMLPGKIKELNNKLEPYNFTVDLYGKKNPGRFAEEYLLTTKNCRDYAMGFSRSLKPHDMNIIMDIPGSEIFLCRKEDIIPLNGSDKIKKFVSGFNYFYRITLTTPELLMFIRYRAINKFIRIKRRWFG
jgi:hypothetical protein